MAYNATQCGGDGMGDYGRPCYGYANTDSPCAVCVLAHMLYEKNADSGGFVETTDKEYPITIIAYRGTKEVTVTGVREDSITSKMDREGNVTLSFELRDDPNSICYIPCVDWYSTQVQ